MATSTLSPFYKSANLTLSGGNLTGTQSAGFNQNNTGLSTTVLPPGKWYWEQVATFGGSTTNYVGIAVPGWPGVSPAANGYLGSDYSSFGYNPNGSWYVNSNSTGGFQTYASGNNVGVAVDTVAGLIWFRINGGNWNNSSSNNPATGVGGIALQYYLVGSAICPCVGTYASGDTGTINLGGSGFTYTAPSGFAAPNTWAIPSGVRAFKATSWYTQTMTYRNYSPLVGGFYAYRTWSPAGPSTNISGTIKEGSTPVVKTVMLFDNNTNFLGMTTSVGGTFTLPALGRTQVWCVAFDPTTYQAQVYDRLTPL